MREGVDGNDGSRFYHLAPAGDGKSWWLLWKEHGAESASQHLVTSFAIVSDCYSSAVNVHSVCAYGYATVTDRGMKSRHAHIDESDFDPEESCPLCADNAQPSGTSDSSGISHAEFKTGSVKDGG